MQTLSFRAWHSFSCVYLKHRMSKFSQPALHITSQYTCITFFNVNTDNHAHQSCNTPSVTSSPSREQIPPGLQTQLKFCTSQSLAITMDENIMIEFDSYLLSKASVLVFHLLKTHIHTLPRYATTNGHAENSLRANALAFNSATTIGPRVL